MIKIEEGKQVGVLYHYTGIVYCLKILSDDTLKFHKRAISFTRNKWFHKQPRTITGTSIRLVIDGDKLSQNYKLEPYNYPGIPDKHSESEERVVCRNISNISKYIIRVEIFVPEVLPILYDVPVVQDVLRYLGLEKIPRSKPFSTELIKAFIEKKYGIECQIVSK